MKYLSVNITTLTCVAHSSYGQIHIPVPRRQSLIQGTRLQASGPQMFPGLKKFLKNQHVIWIGAKPKHWKGIFQAPLGQAQLRLCVSRVHVPSKEPRVQMRIYGAHSQLLKPGEKMQFNALCQITGYACSPGILERCTFRLYLCHIGGPRKLEKVNLRRLCPLVTIFSGRSATSI